MKKYISFALVIAIIASIIAVPVTGFAQDNRIIVSQSFNDIVTGTSPTGDTVTSGNAIVVVTKEGKEKGLELSKSTVESSVYMAGTASEDIISLYIDLKYLGGWSKTTFYIQNSENKQFTLANSDEKGALFAASGRKITTIPKDRDTSIQLTYYMESKRMSVYIDGKPFMGKRYMGKSAFADVSGFGVKVTGEKNKSLVVDNFAIFEGEQVFKSSFVPKAAFLNESVALQNTENLDSSGDGEYVGDAVYISRSFDEGDDIPLYDTLKRGGSSAISVEESLFDGNKYLQINKTEPKESYIAFSGNPDGNYMILEADISTNSNTPRGKLLYTRDERNGTMFSTFLYIAADGTIKLYDNSRVVGRVERMKWLHLGVKFNLKAHTFDVYVDGESVYENIPFQHKNYVGYSQFRMCCESYNDTGTLLIDNLKLYDGNDFRDIDFTVRKSRPTKDSVARDHIDMNKAVSPFADTYYTDLEKHNAKHSFILENDDEICYMHKEDLEAVFGTSLALDGVYGENPDYYDVSAVAKANGYIETKLDTRLFIFSKSSVELTEEQLLEVHHYMFHERPTADELIELFNSYNQNQRPRVLMNADDLAKIKALKDTDPYMKKWTENIFKKADKMIGRKPYTYKLTGTSMADVSESVNEIGCICLAYLLSGEEKYLTTTWDFLVNICNMKDFSPAGYLDYGELPFVLAVGYDWLYDYWTEEQRAFLRDTIYEKAVHFTYRMYHDEFPEGKDMYTEWWNTQTNFNGVINGGLIASAIAIMDTYPEISAGLIEISKKALEYFVDAYYPDGAWHEGNTYWAYAMLHFTHGVKSMENAFGTSFKIYEAPGMSKTGMYATHLTGSTSSFGIGDTSASGFVNNRTLQYLASYYNDASLMGVRKNEYDIRGFNGDYHDMIYYDPELMKLETTLGLDSYMAGMEAITLREAWYDAGATSVKIIGPKNRRTHGHMDTGSFQIDMAGERFILDPGAEVYEAKGGYFSGNRYRFYMSRPEGHNLYIINPKDSVDYYGQVRETKGKGELIVSKPKGAIGVMDLTAPYSEWATKAIRGVMLADDRRSITIRDEIDLIEPNSEVHWFAHTYADKIEFTNDKTAVITMNGKKVLVTIDTNGTDVEFKEAEPVTLAPSTLELVSNTNLVAKGMKKLAIVCKGTGRLNITVKFKQFDDDMVSPEPAEGDISTWTIPDGEVIPLPKAEAIFVNGEPLEDFDGAVTGYSYLMPTSATKPYQISVQTSNKYEIIQADKIGGDAVIRVYSPVSDSIYRTYRVNFWQKAPLADVDGLRRYPVYKATSSENATANNIPEASFDGDFMTWWSSVAEDHNVGEWLMLELDDVFPVEKIGIAWYNGSNRVGKYKLEVSEDGVNWTTVYDGETKKNDLDKPEYTELGGKNVKFVKITGYGTSINDYVMVGEVQILGNQR